MQTYYDGGQRKWVTRQADGTVRDATNAEALDAYSRGAQAPVGSSGPALPATPATPAVAGGGTGGQPGGPATPAPVAAPGTGPGHWQQGGGGTAPVWVPDPQPGGGTAGGPPPDWRTQQSWWGSLFPTGTLQRTAYDLNPDFAWNTLVNHQVANSASPEYSWLQGQQSRDYALYGDQNTRLSGTNDPARNMTFADWIEQNAPTFHQQFAQLSPNQKGYTDYFNPAGRTTF